MLVACFLSELSVIVNVLRTDELSGEDSGRSYDLLVSTVDQRVVHGEQVRVRVAYEASVSQTEGTLSQAEVVSDNSEVEIGVLVLRQELPELVKSSVEAVVKGDLIHAPVAPVLDVLDSGRISVKSEGNEHIRELVLYVFDKYRGVKSDSSDTDIIDVMYELTYLLTNNRVYFILVHRQGVDKVVECDVVSFALIYVVLELVHGKVRNDGGGTSAGKTVVLEFTIKACDAVLFVGLLDYVEQLIVEITANIKGD